MNPSHFVYHRKYIVELWTIEQPFGIHNNSLFYFNIFVFFLRAKKNLGKCFKLVEDKLKIFSRVMLLFQIFMTLPSSDNNVL